MNERQAANVARKAMLEVMQKLHFDANLYEMGQITYQTEKAHKKREELREAIRVIVAMAGQGRLF